MPTIWQGVLPELAGREHKLRDIGCGGSAVPVALSKAWHKPVGLPILQAWGMTETSPVASSGVLQARFDDADDETKAGPSIPRRDAAVRRRGTDRRRRGPA